MNQEEKAVGKVKIGKIMDAHGIRGEIGVVVFSGDVSWIDDAEVLYIPRKNVFEEHKIKKIRPHKKGFICHLENFLDRNKAEEYKGREVWVDEDIFVSEDGESIYLSEILHFEVIDSQMGSLGRIEAFSSNGIQDLLVIHQEGKEIEIPFVKEFVLNIDFENQKIEMELPEGLLQINEGGDADDPEQRQELTDDEE
jgi:16S rRNA processing protein RimM